MERVIGEVTDVVDGSDVCWEILEWVRVIREWKGEGIEGRERFR